MPDHESLSQGTGITRPAHGEPADMYNDPSYASPLEVWTARQVAKMDIGSAAIKAGEVLSQEELAERVASDKRVIHASEQLAELRRMEAEGSAWLKQPY